MKIPTTTIDPMTPYFVIDTQSNEVVYQTTYMNRKRARYFANRKDLEYGAVRYLPTLLKPSDKFSTVNPVNQ